jgi:hypothetical protein
MITNRLKFKTKKLSDGAFCIKLFETFETSVSISFIICYQSFIRNKTSQKFIDVLADTMFLSYDLNHEPIKSSAKK